MANLAEGQIHDFGGLFQGETGKVVKLGDSCGGGVGLVEAVHGDTDFDELLSVDPRPVGLEQGVVERQGDFSAPADIGEAFTCAVDEDATHGMGGHGVELFAIADVPAAPSDSPQPNLVDQFRWRKRHDSAFTGEMADRDLPQLGKYLSQHGVGDLAVAPGIADQTFG